MAATLIKLLAKCQVPTGHEQCMVLLQLLTIPHGWLQLHPATNWQAVLLQVLRRESPSPSPTIHNLSYILNFNFGKWFLYICSPKRQYIVFITWKTEAKENMGKCWGLQIHTLRPAPNCPVLGVRPSGAFKALPPWQQCSTTPAPTYPLWSKFVMTFLITNKLHSYSAHFCSLILKLGPEAFQPLAFSHCSNFD